MCILEEHIYLKDKGYHAQCGRQNFLFVLQILSYIIHDFIQGLELQRNEVWVNHTLNSEILFIYEKNEIMKLAGKRIEPEIIIPREVTQSQKDKYDMYKFP